MATIFIAKEFSLSVAMAIIIGSACLLAGYGFAESRFKKSEDKGIDLLTALNGAVLGGIGGAVLVGIAAGVQAALQHV